MLPDALSSGETSLLPDVSRLSVVTEFVVREDGEIGDTKIYRARVVNKAKLVYEDVGAWLEGAPRAPPFEGQLADQLHLQDEAAQRLRSRRIAHGALQLETIEARPVSRDGDIVAITLVHKSRASELIEDLMIAANGATARYLEEKRFASLRRVVRTPRRWDRIVEVARDGERRFPPSRTRSRSRSFS